MKRVGEVGGVERDAGEHGGSEEVVAKGCTGGVAARLATAIERRTRLTTGRASPLQTEPDAVFVGLRRGLHGLGRGHHLTAGFCQFITTARLVPCRSHSKCLFCLF